MCKYLNRALKGLLGALKRIGSDTSLKIVWGVANNGLKMVLKMTKIKLGVV
ncbi:hypothetical protein [Ureibacillus terrenus]|uniref:hypothetical protein n=1 Tax=Ureibacillus terrenus TaxID=118246 RepID=UPI002E1ED443|nr:hypothetical protein [Ureibacillus terrenus]